MTCGATTVHHAFMQPWSMTVICDETEPHKMHKGTGWGGTELFTVLWANSEFDLLSV